MPICSSARRSLRSFLSIFLTWILLIEDQSDDQRRGNSRRGGEESEKIHAHCRRIVGNKPARCQLSVGGSLARRGFILIWNNGQEFRRGPALRFISRSTRRRFLRGCWSSLFVRPS
jgi:hypothetical protein